MIARLLDSDIPMTLAALLVVLLALRAGGGTP